MAALLAADCASVMGQSPLYETMVILSERRESLSTLGQVAGARSHWVAGKQLLIHLLHQSGVISF